MIGSHRIIVADVLEGLRQIPDESVHCVCTSPPYYNLRCYGVEGQLGMEPTPDEFIANMVGVFREVRRVLRGDGVCFVNMGDFPSVPLPRMSRVSSRWNVCGHSASPPSQDAVP